MTVDEVKCWTVLNGIGHAVAEIDDGWLRTACDSLISGNRENTQSGTPRRICAKCRKRLKDAKPVRADQ